MVICPYCQSETVKRDGVTIKGFQRFYCHFCKKYWQGNYIRKKSTIFDYQKKLIAWAQSHPVLSQYLVAIASNSTFFLACPSAEYHGLCVQFDWKGKSSQAEYRATISAGYAFITVSSYQEALEKIENYLLSCQPHLSSM